MRLLNLILYFILMWIAFWAFRANAQLTENGPDLVQSNTCPVGTASPATCTFYDPVTSGDLEVVCANWFDNNSQTMGFTSGLGTTLAALGGTGTTLVTATGGGHSANIQCTFGGAISTGAETFTVTYSTGSNISLMIAEFKNISSTVDTACSATTGLSATSLTTSCTTTKNGDLLMSFAGNWSATTNIYTQPPNQFAVGQGAQRAQLLSFQLAGAAGAQSVTDYTNTILNLSPAWAMLTVAFQPTAKIMTTSALPDAATTTAYSATLQCVGGTGADTFSITAGALQTGLSLNASTGTITGTPSTISTNSITFKCDDGTLNASRTLNLQVGSSFATPLLKQVKYGTAPDNSFTFSSPVAAGDLILLLCNGPHTNGSKEWIEPTSGTNNYIGDSLGAAFHRLPPIVAVSGNNVRNGATVRVYAGIVPTSGTETVTDTSSSGAPCRLSGEDWSGLQAISDFGAGGSQAGFSSSAASVTTGNYNAAVPNLLLHGSAAGGHDALAGSGPTDITSPFTDAITAITRTGITSTTGYDQVTATGNYTATVAATSLNAGADALAVELLGLRPALPVANIINIGEKHRRQIY